MGVGYEKLEMIAKIVRIIGQNRYLPFAAP